MAPRTQAEEIASLHEDVAQVRQEVSALSRDVAAHQARAEERHTALLSALSRLEEGLDRQGTASQAQALASAEVAGAARLARYVLPLLLGLGTGAGGVQAVRALLSPPASASPAEEP